MPLSSTQTALSPSLDIFLSWVWEAIPRFLSAIQIAPIPVASILVAFQSLFIASLRDVRIVLQVATESSHNISAQRTMQKAPSTQTWETSENSAMQTVFGGWKLSLSLWPSLATSQANWSRQALLCVSPCRTSYLYQPNLANLVLNTVKSRHFLFLAKWMGIPVLTA